MAFTTSLEGALHIVDFLFLSALLSSYQLLPGLWRLEFQSNPLGSSRLKLPVAVSPKPFVLIFHRMKRLAVKVTKLVWLLTRVLLRPRRWGSKPFCFADKRETGDTFLTRNMDMMLII